MSMLRHIAALFLGSPALLLSAEIHNPAELLVALRDLKAGDTLRIAPGDYPGGHHVIGIERLTVEALDPKNPPRFTGGANAWHFSRCHGLTLRHLHLDGQTANGLNLDDGGDLENPTTGVTVENLHIHDIGPQGNHDGIKCSGLSHLTIRNCTLAAWGGQGIDFVGCHQSLITGCRFEGREGFTATAAIQIKGGSSDVIVEKCHFVNAGERPLNLGGSTGMSFFRPPGVKHEAARLIIRENLIEGSSCAAAFVGVDGAEFSGNAIHHPTKWIFRVLQETQAPGFTPCKNVIIKDNKIIFRRSQVRTEVNIGEGTSPQTFRFEGNIWFAEDHPEQSKPKLPVEEVNGGYGKKPR